MNNPKKIFLAYKKGETFIGTVKEVSEKLKIHSNSILRAKDGAVVNGYLVKQIKTITIIYCVNKNGKVYKSTNPKDFERLVWYPQNTIRRYCIDNFTLIDGTKFYCEKIAVDYEKGNERKYIE